MNFWEFLNARAVRNANIDILIGRTQRNNTYLYAFIFVLSIALLIFLPNPSEVAKTILIGSAATLGTILIMQNTFWYGRPRGIGTPDPATTTMETNTSIKTGPSGSAHPPAPAITGDPNVDTAIPFPLAAGPPAGRADSDPSASP